MDEACAQETLNVEDLHILLYFQGFGQVFGLKIVL